MKTVSVSEIIRTAQLGNTLYILATEAEAEITQLKEWKESALEVESRWDCQAVGRLLGVKLGGDIRSKIQPGIEALQAEIAALRERQRVLVDFVNYLVGDQIYTDLPLEHVYSEDARYNWPHRWKTVLELARAALAAKEE